MAAIQSMLPSALTKAFLCGILYYLSASLSVNVLTLDSQIALLWLPNAILLSALLLSPVKHWPYFLVATFCAELAADIPVFTVQAASLFALVNIFECLLITLIIRRYIRIEYLIQWNHPPRVLAFILVVLFIATPLAAAGGALVNYYIVEADKAYLELWRLWWLGDASGLLTLTPVCIHALHLLQHKSFSVRLLLNQAYFISVTMMTLVLWVMVFSFSERDSNHTFAFTPFLIALPILWDMLKLNSQQKVVISALLALSTALMTVTHMGPFYQSNVDTAALLTQEFILIFTSIIYMVSAYYTQAIEKNLKLTLFESAFESAREGIIITEADNDQPIVFSNPAFEMISGYRAEEMYGHNCRFLNRRHPDQENLERIRQAIKRRAPVNAVVLNTTKQGTDFWNNLSITPIYSDKGKVTHFVGIQQDITERVTASQLLEEQVEERTRAFSDSQERLALATSVSGLGIWEWNLETNELVWDAQMHNIYQTPESVKHSGLFYDFWYESVHPEDIEYAAKSLNEAVQFGHNWENEFRLKLRDGQIKIIKASAAIKLDEDGTPVKVVGSNLDITQQRAMEDRLTRSLEDAQKATLAKSEFLANMSHEIRTPMNGVLGMTELIKTTPLNSRQKEYLGMIESSAKSLLHLLNDILDLSKIEAGQLSLDPVRTCLDESVGDVMKGFSIAAHNKGLDIHYYIHPDVPTYLIIDRLRLGQILFNLIGNAVKFTDQGEVSLEILVDQQELKQGDSFNLKVVISDTGIGIPEDKQKEIFNPFHQADSSITRKYGGTGLGLPIVSHLVKLMGGTITLYSKPDQGTRFSLSLPAICSDQAQMFIQPEHTDLRQNFSSLKVLAVDDNPINLRWLNDMVVSWGCQVKTAASVEQAFSALIQAEQENRPFSILLTDKNMPGKSGFDLVKMLDERKISKPSVIIMLSSSEVEQDIQTASQLGIVHFLLKPVKQSEVFNAILDALDRQHSLADTKTTASHSHPLTPLSILVAEDNPINQRIVNDILQQRGHAITLVDNGALAVKMSAQHHYDVILMDIQMPEMDGFEATRLIREQQQESTRKSRIIGVSAHALKGDKEQGLQSGMDDYLTKPLYAEQLIRVVELERVAQATFENTKDHPAPSPSTAPSPAVFDLERARKVTANDKALLYKICNMALELLPQMMDKIDTALQDADGEAMREHLHKLTGMLANLCRAEFIQQMKTLESNTCAPLTEQDAQQWSLLKVGLKGLKTELETRIQKETLWKS